MTGKTENGNWILFVHGSEHDTWCWTFFEKYFSKREIHTESVSLQTNGSSNSLDDYAEKIHKAVNRQNVNPIIITHSLGSSILQRYLKKYNDPIKKIVFLSPTPPKHIWRTLFQVKCNMLRQNKASLFFSNKPDAVTIKKYIGKLKRESFKAQMQAMKRVWNKTDVPKIPCLVIGAWDDRCMPISSICDMGRFLNSKTVILPDLSHDMMLAPEWERVADEILIFIDEE